MRWRTKSPHHANRSKVVYDDSFAVTSVPSIWVIPRYRAARRPPRKRKRRTQLMNFSHRKWFAAIWQRTCGNNGPARKSPKWPTNWWHRPPKSSRTFQSVIVGMFATLLHGNPFDWKSEFDPFSLQFFYFQLLLILQYDHRENYTAKCTPRRRQTASSCSLNEHGVDAISCKIRPTSARRKSVVCEINAGVISHTIVSL